MRFFGGKQIEFVSFVLQIKNGTNCMFMYSFIVFVGVRFLMKPGTLVLCEKLLMMIPYGSKMFSFCVMCCSIAAVKMMEGSFRVLKKDEVHMCWGLNSYFFPVLGDGHNLIVGVYILIISKDSLLKVG